MHILFITNKYRLKLLVIILITTLVCILSYNPVTFTLSQILDENELKIEIERIYNVRSTCLATGDFLPLKSLFDTSQKYGQWSLDHEVRRVKYLKDWSSARGISFINIESTVRIKKIYNRSSTVKISLEESYKFDYIYISDPEPVINTFGVGIRHTLDLVEKNEVKVIYSDWYTDCFEDAMSHYSGNIPDAPTLNQEPVLDTSTGSYELNLKSYYDRQKAVEYADKYCGAPWGSKNNFKYNKIYMDYNGAGGDCTNFISQVLGDKGGGSIPSDSTWHSAISKYGNSPGSSAWVNAKAFKDYLLYSGKGSVIRKGTYKELTSPFQGAPNGAVAKLQLGDLVCYEKKGHIDHFAVITGRDSRGYPLVNSHTTDRYHVPWDLGWSDSGIKFFLIHING